jgi:hypothetical protein
MHSKDSLVKHLDILLTSDMRRQHLENEGDVLGSFGGL